MGDDLKKPILDSSSDLVKGPENLPKASSPSMYSRIILSCSYTYVGLSGAYVEVRLGRGPSAKPCLSLNGKSGYRSRIFAFSR